MWALFRIKRSFTSRAAKETTFKAFSCSACSLSLSFVSLLFYPNILNSSLEYVIRMDRFQHFGIRYINTLV